jgi:cytochrome c-type biogenesis protein CcmH/NrfG
MKRLLILFLCGVFSLSFVACKDKSQPPRGGSTFPSGAAGREGELSALNKIVANDPTNVKAYVAMGNIYFDTNRNADAVTAYKKALELNPDDPNVRTDMGVCLKRLGRIDEAVSEFKKASRSDPRHFQSRYNLGVTLLQNKKDLRGALSTWEALVRDIPQFPGREGLITQIKSLKSKEITGTPVMGEKNKGK